MKTSPAYSLLLHHPRHSRHQVTPVVTRAGLASGFFREYNADNNHPTPAYLAEITDHNTLPDLRRLGLFSNALLPDVIHQTYEAEFVEEYV